MKIAIISDSHDNLANLRKAAFLIKGAELVIHCGDVCSPSALKGLFDCPVKVSFGNADNVQLFSEESYETENIEAFSDFGEVETGGKKIAFVHYPHKGRKLARSGKYDLVFYGHTHQPWKEKEGECLLVNPGNIAGIIYKASFAFYDTEKDKLDLKIL